MIHLELVNHDKIYDSLKYPPILVNDVDVKLAEEKERLNTLLYTRYEGDTLDVMPSCDCGQLRGQVNANIRCQECGSVCASVTEKPLESMLWIEAPKGVDTLINPMAWLIISKEMTITSCSVLEWLTDPFYQPPNEKAMLIAKKLEDLDLPRGLNEFYNNFDEIMRVVFENRLVKGSKRHREDVMQFIRENRKAFFPQHIPIPSRLGFIIETTNTGVYADTSMAQALDAIRTISSIATAITPLRQKSLESRTVKAVKQLASYYRTFFVGSLGQKTGWFRKHVFGSRLHFTGRAVISSLSENHDYEEVHLPWGLAVQLLKVHLSNKLIRRGYTPNQISELFYSYAMTYHEVLDELFRELIEESPYKGIPIILQRNPSLVRGSAQLFYVTKVKSDPLDYTISMSVLTLAAPNADEVSKVA